MSDRRHDEVRTAVRRQYGEIATTAGRPCCQGTACGGAAPEAAIALGYSAAEVASAPAGSDLGLGCGNPGAIAALEPGEVVLDLGSGGGFDCFLAASRVGPEGRVIGVDMTPEMVARSRETARRAGLENVEFRLGEVEQLPVASESVDVVLSNCAINLSPEKARVLREAHRVLRPGGRLAISDVLEVAPLPEELRESTEALTGCVAGAAPVAEMERMLRQAGFCDVRISVARESRTLASGWLPGSGAEEYVAAARIEALKPTVAGGGGAARIARGARAACCAGGDGEDDS